MIKFIKTFDVKTGRQSGNGSLIIRDGFMIIRLNTNKICVHQIGLTEDGIGVTCTESKTYHKTPYVVVKFKYNPEDLPENFRGEGYKFRIPADKISEKEYVFKFNKAKMLNKK